MDTKAWLELVIPPQAFLTRHWPRNRNLLRSLVLFEH